MKKLLIVALLITGGALQAKSHLPAKLRSAAAISRSGGSANLSDILELIEEAAGEIEALQAHVDGISGDAQSMADTLEDISTQLEQAVQDYKDLVSDIEGINNKEDGGE